MVVRKIFDFISPWKKEEHKMTENKRFEIKQSAMDNNRYVIHDSKKEYTFPVLDSTLNYMFCKALNELSDENEQLRKENDMLSCELSVSANKEISRNCRIAELEEENEQLKQHNVELINKIDFLERVIDGDVE